MLNDFIIGGVLILIIAFIAIISEIFGTKGYMPREYSRKMLHFVSVLAAALSVFLIESRFLLIIFAAIATIFTVLAIKFNLFQSIHDSNRKSWGIFFFPLAFLFQLLFLPESKNWIIFLSLSILAISDSLAAIIGKYLGDKTFSLSGDTKSYWGSAAFFVSSFLAIISFIGFANGFDVPFQMEITLQTIIISVIISLILTIIEAFSSYGSDNFFIPLFASILFLIFFNSETDQILNQFLIGMLLAGIVAFLSYRARFLTANGSVATFLLAGFVFGLGAIKWSVPILTFFILSSLLSKYRKRANYQVENYFEKTGVRDYQQVLANGGIGGILVIVNAIYPHEIFYYLYLSSLAAVCADTWSTEIGTLKSAATYNVLNFKPVQQGVSGGISVPGTLGGILGAFTIAISGFYWIDLQPYLYFPLLVMAGFAGNVFDSVLGATLQVQFQCSVCNKVTERKHHCNSQTNYFKGLKWINNDFVNLCSAIMGILIIILANGFFK